MESCLVCKSIVSTSKRRRLCNEASSHVLPLLGEWLEKLPGSPIACLKCFGMLEKVIRLRKNVKEVEDVLQSYLAPLTPAVTDGTCNISTQTDETFSASVHQSDSSPPRLAVMSDSADSAFVPSTPKRRRICLQRNRLRLRTTGKSPSLAVLVKRKTGCRIFNITNSLKKLGHGLSKKNRQGIARQVIRDKVMLSKAIGFISRKVKQEIKHMCSYHVNSVLRKSTPEAMQSFQWKTLIAELTTHAPTFYKVLGCCLVNKNYSKQNSHKQVYNAEAITGMIAAIFLRYSSQRMNLAQRLISVVLYNGHAEKQVYSRLQKLMLCLSHRATISCIDRLGENHDADVLEWKNWLTERMQGTPCEQPVTRDGTDPSLSSAAPCEHSSTPQPGQSGTDPSLSSAAPCEHSSTPQPGQSTGVDMATPSADLDGNDSDSSGNSGMASLGRISPLTLGSATSDSFASLDSLMDEIFGADIPNLGQCYTFKVVGDNVDKSVHPRHMRMDSQTKSLHYFHIYAVLDRIDFSQLDDNSKVPDVKEIDFTDVMPSLEDEIIMKKYFSLHIVRALKKYSSFFRSVGKGVERHVQHQFSAQMARKSDIVPLGILLKSEMHMDDMIDILKHVQRYVPTVTSQEQVVVSNDEVTVITDSFHKILLGGDQLTAARIRSSQRIVKNSERGLDRLEGLTAVIEDWHAKQCMMQVFWKRLFSFSSSSEGGTLYQLRNAINRRNVVNDPKKNMNACEEFFLNVTDAHILAAVMTEHDMSSMDEVPAEFLRLKSLDSLHQRIELMSIAEEIVQKHVDISFVTEEDSDDSENDEGAGEGDGEEEDAERDVEENGEGDGEVGGEEGGERDGEEGCAGDSATEGTEKGRDHVLDYGRDLLTCGLLLKEFTDAVHEGDGQRIFRCWKYFLLFFRATKRTNYAIEAFNLLAQYHYIFSPRLAEQLMWSRTVNVHGHAGKNISCDIHMEHLNRLCKSSLGGLASNISDRAVERIGRCIGEIVKVIANFDADNYVPIISGKHKVPTAKKDIEKMVEQLKKYSIFSYCEGRSHAQFEQHNNNVMSTIDLKEHKVWMARQLKKLLLYNH